jgi:hypothetical protein
MSKLRGKGLWEVAEELQYQVYDAITETDAAKSTITLLTIFSECNWEGTSIYDYTSTPTPNPKPLFSNDDLLLHYEGNDSSTPTVVKKSNSS